MNLNKWLSDNKITEVECLVSDIAGIPRGKIVPVEKYIKTSSSEGLRLPEYVFGQNVRRCWSNLGTLLVKCLDVFC